MSENNEFKNRGFHFGGIFMIFIGIVYFLATFDVIGWGSIGYIFAIIPAMFIVFEGYRVYQKTGRLSRAVIVRLAWGLFPFVFLGLIYAGVSAAQLWPMVLILIGGSILLGQNDPTQ